MSPPTPTRTGPLPLLFFAAALLVRWPVLLAYLDTWYPFEMFSGFVASGLLDGLDFDLPKLTIIPHIRGGPLFGALMAPLYALFGATTLTMKLVPWLWHASTVALAVFVAARFFGRSAGWTTGGLLLLAPPLLAKLSVIGFASHLESSLPMIAAFGLTLSLARSEPAAGRRLGSWFGLGLITGFAAFFHLQALLPCLILLALLAVRRPREMLRGLLPLAVGAALAWSPTLLFESDDKNLVEFVLGSGRADEARVSESGTGVSHYGRRGKTRALLTSGLGPVLEFGSAGPTASPVLAHLYGVALLLACALALWRDRKGLLAWLQRLAFWRRRTTQPSVLAFLPLHVAAVLTLFVLSGMALNFWAAGSGMEGRRITPALVSLVLLAGVGLARDDHGRRSVAGWVAMIVLYATGAWGAWSISAPTPASRLAVRGDCYEWYMRQLEHHAGGDQQRLVEELQRLDHGDPRFLTLRFALNVGIGPRAPFDQNIARATAPTDDPLTRLLRLTALGRSTALPRKDTSGRRLPELLVTLPQHPALARLTADERATIFHGAGLNLMALLPRTVELPVKLKNMAVTFPSRDSKAVFEGYGFAQGFVYTHYNEFHRVRFANFAELPPSVRQAFYRGFGWGRRQRWVDPPSTLPDGLRAWELVPEEAREAFLDGLLARKLPYEAELLAALTDS